MSSNLLLSVDLPSINSNQALTFVTALLALITAYLAYTTRQSARHVARSADAAETQSYASQQSLAAMIQPLIVDVPRTNQKQEEKLTLPGLTGNNKTHTIQGPHAIPVLMGQTSSSTKEEAIVFSVPVRNVGSGTAIINRAEFSFMGYATTSVRIAGVVLPTGEMSRINAVVPLDKIKGNVYIDKGNKVSAAFHLRIWYSNAHGTGRLLTQLRVQPGVNSGHAVWEMKMFNADDTEPFAVTEYVHEETSNA